ncbi:covalently-linked cell wall protein [Colletotrichum kahawae]|uniref:Covalently-linked cell wall protein n=1 Tax=Colletotrichum kahawae TaxID=34407 RepID=A0AAE0DC60_COLKA|nr:covalently-linked cell wall protein [Colletotrichum kahawae]
MKYSASVLATLTSAVLAMPQAGSAALAPKEAAPAGCQTSYSGKFGITIVGLGKRSLETRSNCGQQGALDLTLKDSVLTDSQGRIGSIVANYQFQFDGPPQSGVIYTSGFSVCGNGSLALGGSTTFYQCQSGDFSNLYDRSWAPQCSPIHLSVLPCGSDAPVPSGNVVGTTMVATTVVTVIGDGQPQVVPTVVPVPICQIGDGQIQGHTTPCGELPPVTVTPPPPAPSAPAPSAPAAPPPGTPVAPPAAPPVPTPAAPPVQPSQPAASQPPVVPPVINTTTPVQPPATTAPATPSSTTPAAPPVAAGQHIAPAPFAALAAGVMAVLYMI